jgi:hypothetical protein
MIIGIVYESREFEGRIVNNIPYNKHDEPCWEGCCENELSIGLVISSKVSWLLKKYMPMNEITEFDFNEWSDQLNDLWKIRNRVK